MSNTYAANFGDVVKHLVLCDVIERERPDRYLESHGGRLDYDLADLRPGAGGVWDFLDLAALRDTLSSSAYASLIRATAGTSMRPGTYPGSIALADALLPAGAEVIAFELSEESASSLRDGLARRDRPAHVTVADGLDGVCRLARPGDLVLIDPFDVQARGDTFTASDAFATLAARAVRALLWYAIYAPTDTGAWIADMERRLDDSFWHVRLIGDTTDGGLAGCGFLGTHLSAETQAAATALIGELASTLAPVRPGLRLVSRHGRPPERPAAQPTS